MFVGAAIAANLTPRAFTDAFAAAATAALPAVKVTVAGDLHLETRTATGDGITTDLRNAYSAYLGDPTKLEDVISRYVAVLADSVRMADQKPALDRSRIVSVLKTPRWVEGVRQAQSKNAQAPQLLTEPFNSELTIVYAEDLPASIRYLTTLDDVGDRAKLHDLALDNLSRLVPKIAMRQGADGIFQIGAGGSYEPSLLLVDELWSSGQIKVDGEIIVAVPAKDALLVTGSRNQTGVTRLRALAAELATGPYALTPILFVYRDGKFVPFDAK